MFVCPHIGFLRDDQRSVCVLGEATFSDRRPPRGDAVGRPEVVPPDLPGGGTSYRHRPSV